MSSQQPGSGTPGDYSWLLEDMPAFGVAGCVTMVENATPGAVLAALGVGQDAPPTTDLAGLYEHGTPAIAFGAQQANWLPIVEWNGIIGANRDNLVRLSRGGRAASCFWNVNLSCRFILASDGKLVYSFEVGMSETEMVGNVAEAKAMNDSFGEPDTFVQQWGMAMLERVTGVRIDQRIVEEATEFYVVPN